jgi:glycerol-3-phosphate dehydrogenase
VLDRATSTVCLLEVPDGQRFFFVLPWNSNFFVDIAEVRQLLDDPIECGHSERDYLLFVYHCWSNTKPVVSKVYAGVRHLLHSAVDPGNATRKCAIQRTGRLISGLGCKWATAMALETQFLATLHLP